MDTNHSPIISPLTMRESARGITLTSIYDEMLARRELSVMGNIETPMAHDLCQQIRLLDATDPSRPITIFVASAGGSVRSGLAIYGAMRLSPCPIHTVCLEFAASMGAIIFMGGNERRGAPCRAHDSRPADPPGGRRLGTCAAGNQPASHADPQDPHANPLGPQRPHAQAHPVPHCKRHLPFGRARRRARLCPRNPLDHQGCRPCLTSPAASPHLSPHRPPSSPRIERFPATPAKRDSTTTHL